MIVYVTDLNIGELDLQVFQIVDAENPQNILENILINAIDAKEVQNVLRFCDFATSENNEYYDKMYHGFFEHLKKRQIWYDRISRSIYKW